MHKRLTFLAAILAVFATSATAQVAIPSSSSVGGVPSSAGDGLVAQYWQLDPKGIIAGENPMKTQAFDIMAASAADLTFTATEFNYQGGNDLTPVNEWTQGDSASITGGDATTFNMGDGFINFSGYIAIDQPGTVDFWIGSDDGSVLWIGDEMVVDNDGGHGAPGPAPNGSAAFESAGLYPVELNYFNGEWTNDAGDHGGANFEWRMGGEGGATISSSVLYTNAVPEPATMAMGLLAALGLLGLSRRK